MKKLILLKLLLIFSGTTGISQVTLIGIVTDKKSGEALPGAAVYLPDLKTGEYSDEKGHYKIFNLPKTKVLVQVSDLGYKTIAATIDLKTTTSMNFEMEEDIMEAGAVVITAPSRTTEIKRTPAPLLILNIKSIDENIHTNIIDAIASLPGISAITTGPNVSKPSIHGLGYNRVVTLYDGIRQEGQQWGDEHGIEIDEYTVSRIEVIKGPSSLIYGPDALAGVINLIPDAPVPDNDIRGSLLSEYQTNNGLIGNSLALSGNKNGLIWGGRISHKQGKNYQNKYDGRVYGTGFNESDVSGYTGLNKKWGYSHLKFSVYDDLQEIPDGSRDSTTRKFTKQISENDVLPRVIVPESELNTYKIATIHQHVQHYRIYSDNNFIIGSGKLGVVLGFQQNVRREFSHPLASDIPGLYLRLNSLTYDLTYSLPDIKGTGLTFGIDGMEQNNTNKGTEFIIPDYSLFDIGAFLHLKKSIGKVDISAGLRWDSRFLTDKELFVAINPSTGFLEKAANGTPGANQIFPGSQPYFFRSFRECWSNIQYFGGSLLKANIARGFRAPDISEISANGVHPGTSIYQIGNSVFKPEFSLQEDIGIFYSTKYINCSLELFNNSISNYIFNQKLLDHNGNDSVIVKGNQTFKFQQSGAVLKGLEGSIDIHPHPLDWLHFENSVSFIYALNKGGNGIQLTDSTKFLPSIPPFHWHSELRAEPKSKVKHLTSWYAKLEMDFYARQNMVYSAYNTETPTKGYTLFNVSFGVNISNKTGKEVLNFSIICNNIADIAYQSHLSRLKYFEQYPVNWTGRTGIYNMGRNIGFKMIIPIVLRS